jgi:hypothetical protein
VERLDIFLPNVPIQNKKKMMMTKISRNIKREKPKTKRRPFTPKRTTIHLKKVKMKS